MTHDFKTAKVSLHGVTKTLEIEKPFGGKNIDKLIAEMADSIMSGKRNAGMPEMRDSAISSEFAWRFLEDAHTHELPAIGNLKELNEIRERRAKMTDGYGLLHKLD